MVYRTYVSYLRQPAATDNLRVPTRATETCAGGPPDAHILHLRDAELHLRLVVAARQLGAGDAAPRLGLKRSFAKDPGVMVRSKNSNSSHSELPWVFELVLGTIISRCNS